MGGSGIKETKNFGHTSVLLNEAFESIYVSPKAVVFDATFGAGGYSEKICQKLSKDGLLIATDLDINAKEIFEERLRKFSCQKKFFNQNFSQIDLILSKLNINKVSLAFFDLGLSSNLLSQKNNGLSFQKENQILDMRFDPKSVSLTAKEIINTWPQKALEDIFFFYGGERASKKIAQKIIEERQKKEILLVGDLTFLIEKEIGKFYKGKKIHPATKIFQALRITVNDEIQNLEEGIRKTFFHLEEEGLIVVVTFHSLEDRVVKKIFKDLEFKKQGYFVNKKVIKPKYEEILKNSRSRSAKLRIFRKKNDKNN